MASIIEWPAIENSAEGALFIIRGKSRLTSSHENVIHVTSGNLDDFKISQISNISVSFVEK